MVEIADLRDCAPSGLFYGGRAGQKEGILIEGEPWIAKYPRTTRDLAGKHLPSYTSSPVSEYLGSHIYELLGIPVHETMLGYRAGKIVCACRDFTFPNARLFEFKEIKNALSDDDAGFNSAPSDGEVVLLGDVLAAIKCFAAAVDMEAIDTLIDSVPEEAEQEDAFRDGVVLLSESYRQRAGGSHGIVLLSGVDARRAQAPSEKASRRGYSSASVNKAACQCGICGYCLSK